MDCVQDIAVGSGWKWMNIEFTIDTSRSKTKSCITKMMSNMSTDTLLSTSAGHRIRWVDMYYESTLESSPLSVGRVKAHSLRNHRHEV